MNARALLLSVANATLYLVTCALLGTGLLLELRLDEDDGADRFLGMGQDDWGEVHFGVAIAFAALAAVHLAQNWTWIKGAIGRSRSAMVVLVAGLFIVAGLLLWPTTSAKVSWAEQLRQVVADD